jgi:hypothetical protein
MATLWRTASSNRRPIAATASSRHFLLLLLLLLATSLTSSSPPLGESCLSALGSNTASRQFVDFGQPNVYCLSGPLRPNALYELKVSCGEPASFALRLEACSGACGGSRGSLSAPPGARGHPTAAVGAGAGTGGSPSRPPLPLWEMEKLKFSTDGAGRVSAVVGDGEGLLLLPEGGPAAVDPEALTLVVAARPRGAAFSQQQQKQPAASGSAAPPPPPLRDGTWYDLRLDEVHGGILPGQARPLLYLVPLAVLLAGLAAWWVLYSPLSPLRQQLEGGGEKRSGEGAAGAAGETGRKRM